MAAASVAADRREHTVIEPQTLRRHKLRLQHRCKVNKLTIEPGFNWRAALMRKPAVTTLKRYQKFVGIRQSGEFDRNTLDALYPSRFRRRVAAIALEQVGVHEWPAGSNSGPVMRFIRPFIGRVPTAWCALLGAWSAWREGFEKADFWPDVAWVDSWQREADRDANRHVTRITKLRAGRGDFALMDWENNNNPDHLVIITAKVGPLATFQTVEGNVGDHGGSVAKKTRLITQAHAFVRLHRYARR